MCHDGPRRPGRRWQEPEQELGQPGFLSGTPAPTVQWPRGVILGRSAVSCCRLDEMGNCPCFRRVCESPRPERMGSCVLPVLCLEPEAALICSCRAFIHQFYSREEAQVPYCFEFALRLARAGRRGLLCLATRAGVGQKRKGTPGASTDSGARPRGLQLWAEDQHEGQG